RDRRFKDILQPRMKGMDTLLLPRELHLRLCRDIACEALKRNLDAAENGAHTMFLKDGKGMEKNEKGEQQQIKRDENDTGRILRLPDFDHRLNRQDFRLSAVFGFGHPQHPPVKSPAPIAGASQLGKYYPVMVNQL